MATISPERADEVLPTTDRPDSTEDRGAAGATNAPATTGEATHGNRRTRRILLLGAAGLLFVLALAWLVVVPAIEADLRTETIADLNAAGIATDGLVVDFDYRTGTVTGTLPPGVTAGAVADAIDVQRAARITVDVEPAPSPTASDLLGGDDPETSGTRIPALPVADGDFSVRTTVGANGVAFTGAVQSDAQRDTLVRAARQRFGPTTVTDDLLAPPAAATGSEAGEGSPAALRSIEMLVATLAVIPPGIEGALVVDAQNQGDAIRFAGVADSEATAASFEAELATVADGFAAVLDVSLNIPPPPPPTPEELATALQSELDGLNATFRTIDRFRIDSFDLSVEFAAALDPVIALMAAHADPVIEIVGHTDDRGRDAFNAELSQQRADAVRSHLVESGADPDRLTIRGAGESEPIAGNDTLAGRIANRRVELVARPSTSILQGD